MPQNADQPPRNKRAVVSCMKNEGMFLLEWVAYHLVIGFDKVFVLTNDCSDGTDKMLDELARIAPVIPIENPIEPGQRPQIEGMRRALAHAEMQDVEWLLHIDSDEFLNVTAGDGQVDDLLAVTAPCDAIAISWRPMGSGGRKVWTHDSVLATQTHTDPEPKAHVLMHKTMFRPDRFRSAIDHMPKDPVDPDVVVKNTVGTVFANDSLYRPERARYKPITDADMVWDNADIHHYSVRSEDIFLLKNIRGDGMAIDHDRYTIGSLFYRRTERNRGHDTSIQRHLPALNAKLAEFRANPTLAQLDRAAFDWFAAMRAQYLTEENRAKWGAA